MTLRVSLVAPALEPIAGQMSYVRQLVRHLPPDIEADVQNLWGGEVRLGGRRFGRTVSAWASYPFVALDGDVIHATDTFCMVKGTDVVTVHDLIPLLHNRELAARIHHRVFAKRFREVARIITLTHAWAEVVARELKVPSDRITVIPHGVDLQWVGRKLPVPGFLAPSRNVLVVGAYRPHKRLHDLIRAAAGQGIRIVRIGPPGNDGYAEACRALARDLGCDFVDVGPVGDATLHAAYRHCDLLFYASEQAGFGLPPLEAMAQGMPALLSDIPAFREVYDGAASFVGRDADLRTALEAALADRPARQALVSFASRFGWAATAAQTAAVYREVAEERGSGPRAARQRAAQAEEEHERRMLGSRIRKA